MNLWKNFSLNEPLKTKAITEVVGVKLPDDYIEFMKKHNGGEGDTGTVYVILFQMEELVEINDDYQIEEFLPGNCIIGSNGGGELFGIDTEGNYFVVPTVFDENDKVKLGKAMNEFIVNLTEFFMPI